MKVSVDAGDRSFLERLHRHGAATVQQLCDEEGVTQTAIRHRLSRLLDGGFVQRETIRASRGRPHHVYVITQSGIRELGTNCSELASILWRELRRIESPEVRRQVEDRVRDALIESYGSQISGATVAERSTQLAATLSDKGFSVEAGEPGSRPVLREHSCPYSELAAIDDSICRMEQEVFERVLGTELSLAQCCRNGDGCCEFHATGPMTLELPVTFTASLPVLTDLTSLPDLRSADHRSPMQEDGQ